MITVNLYYKGINGNARAFAEEMESSGIADAVRAEEGNLRYQYFQPMRDPETVLLIDSWIDQAAIDEHHSSPMMKQIAELREKYDLHMTVERFISDDYEDDKSFIREWIANESYEKTGFVLVRNCLCTKWTLLKEHEWKCIGYAGLYKAYGKSVNAIPQEELTISIFRHRYPSKLMSQLKESGYLIENLTSGIYYIKGLVDIPVQIVVSKDLDDEAFAALKVMAKQSDPTDIVEFISQARVLTEPRLRQAADNIFQISASINKRLFNELRKEDAMCQALREIMAPEIEESYNEGRIEGITEGRAEGRVALIKDMLRLGSTPEDISKLSGVPLEFILEIERSMRDAE